MNLDPRVMEYLLPIDSHEASDAVVDKLEAKFDRQGFGIWAVEVPGVAPFIGFVGLNIPSFTAAFTPCVEIAWRLAFDYWNQGFATEAARVAVGYGFEKVGLSEIVAFTAPANVRSRRVMEKLGMTYNPADDFDYPGIPDGHPLRRHVLYRLVGATKNRTRRHKQLVSGH